MSWALEESLPATLLDQLTSQLHARSSSPSPKTPLHSRWGLSEKHTAHNAEINKSWEPDPVSDLQHGPSMNQGPSRDRKQEGCEGQNIKKSTENPSALERAAKPRLQQMAESADKELQAALDR